MSEQAGSSAPQPRRKRIVWRAALVAFLLVVALFFGMRLYIARGFPQLSGTLNLPGLQSQVLVFRDEWGVPHIYADNEHDALFAQGFVHAQDRRFQMEGIAGTALGTLAELGGVRALDQDLFMRSIDLAGIADRMVAGLPQRIRDGLDAYCEGVNAAAALDPPRVPLELRMLEIEPQPWTPRRVAAVFLLNSWMLAMNFSEERIAADLSATLPQDKIELLFGLDEPATLSPGTAAGPGEVAILDIMQRLTNAPASNNWVVGPSKSASGAPLLANDPHLGLTLPCVWYEVHVECPQFKFSGFSIPGAPFIAIGRNADVAWGFTNLMTDNADLVLEKVKPASAEVLTPTGWVKLTPRQETFAARNAEAQTRTMYRGPNGPIVIMPTQDALDADGVGTAYALRWVGENEQTSLQAFAEMVAARNSDELIQAVRLFDSLSQHMAYVDISGSFGRQGFGKVPLRAGYSGKFPVAGWESDAKHWTGFAPFEMLPAAHNPEVGYAQTANADMDDALGYTVSQSYVRPYRFERIGALLADQGGLDLDKLAVIQGDTLSLQSAVYLDVVFAEAGDAPEAAELVGLLRQWDRRLEPDSAAAAIYEVFLGELWRLWLADELGELFEPYARRMMGMSSPPDDMLADPANPFWDDVSTPDRIETRGEIIKAALAQTKKTLVALLGSDSSRWSWGALHGAFFAHPAGATGLAGKLLSFGPFPVGGDPHAINANSWSMGEGYGVTHYPSMRFLFDAADPDHPRNVITTGQSGHPGNNHYSDQAPLWAAVQYKPMLWLRSEVEQASGRRRLVLDPGVIQ